jgi:hypothetical protein
MKKQINPTIKAHLIRSAFYLLLLLGVLAIPFALAQSRSRGTTRQSVANPATQTSTSLAEGLTSEQKQPLDRSPGTQTAEVPSRIGYVQKQPKPLVPQLVGVDKGVEIEPNNTFGTATSLGANPEGRIRGQNFSGGPPASAGEHYPVKELLRKKS